MATTPFDSLRDLDRWLAGNMVRTQIGRAHV